MSKDQKHLNVKPDTLKLLEENIGRTRSDINHSNIFLYVSHNNGNNNKHKWDLLNLKSFCTTKETTTKTKRQPQTG